VLNSVSRDIRVLKGLLGLRKVFNIRVFIIFISKYKADKEVLNILYNYSYLLGFYSLFNLYLL
jgi:lipid-A-disaccharide synthase-like uncharacterized protein